MKQVIQDLSTGVTELINAPEPSLLPGHLLIDTSCSMISAGTERMLVEFGKAGVLSKARQQPEKVRQVLDKVQTDGLLTTVEAVRSKLGQPIPLGYCNVGTVSQVGAGVNGFQPGDRVVSNGPHADVVRVPANLCAFIPENVSDDAAAFTVLASIGLQGVRLAAPTLGESFVVTGVGLIGLLVVQLLVSSGCRVMAIDYDERKLALAKRFGAEICNPGVGQDPMSHAAKFSRGNGVDGVIIAASTKSNEPVTQAARMCRKRGRVILTGVAGLELNRADFYEKEISFQVSCSYGPGRYDPSYEYEGHDYPLGFVRWTEQRNFVAVLDMLATDRLDVIDLITHEHAFDDAPAAYSTLAEDPSALGILLRYDHPVPERHTSTVTLRSEGTEQESKVAPKEGMRVGMIGAGNYASRVLIPAIRATDSHLEIVASSGGTNGAIHGRKLGFALATSDTNVVMQDDTVNTVVIATRHDTHASLTLSALQSGKHVFVEKPLALKKEDVIAIENFYAGCDRLLMVGFNRRFAPLVQRMKTLIDPIAEPKSIIMVMNAGAIPADHWTQDREIGGGRILGEACHHIDLMRFLVGHEIVSVKARRMGSTPGMKISEDKSAILLGFADGSFGTIHYLANGGSAFPKERVEVFAGGAVLQMENYLKLRGFGWKGFSKETRWRQDKGQTHCIASFADAIRNGVEAPIAASELFEVAHATIQAVDQLRDQ